MQRWKRAQDTFALADQSLKQALSDYKGLFAYVVSFCYLHLHACIAVCEANVQQMIEEDQKAICVSSSKSQLKSSIYIYIYII